MMTSSEIFINCTPKKKKIAVCPLGIGAGDFPQQFWVMDLAML